MERHTQHVQLCMFDMLLLLFNTGLDAHNIFQSHCRFSYIVEIIGKVE
jgi:hypothetical protein